jgi:hypothetical protein
MATRAKHAAEEVVPADAGSPMERARRAPPWSPGAAQRAGALLLAGRRSPCAMATGRERERPVSGPSPGLGQREGCPRGWAPRGRGTVLCQVLGTCALTWLSYEPWGGPDGI